MNILESLECKISIEYNIWIQSAVSKSRTTPCSVRTRPTMWYHGYTVYKSTLAKSEITVHQPEKNTQYQAPFIPFRPLCCNPTIRSMHGHIRVYNAHLYQYTVYTYHKFFTINQLTLYMI